MWHLYLDESGDLGFDFANKKPSKYFTISILLVKGIQNNRALINGVKNTLRRKLNPKGNRKRLAKELKGNKTTFEVKRYLFEQLRATPFELYCVTLSKRDLLSEKLSADKHRLYNYISRMALEQTPLAQAMNQVTLTIDKSKNKSQIREFNSFIIEHLHGQIDLKIPVDIEHRTSEQEFGLQAADMFSWGVFRKYESGDIRWFEVFEDRIKCDLQYP